MSSFFKKKQKEPTSNCGTTVLAIIGVFLIFIILFGVWGTCTESGKSTFTNIKDKFTGEDLKELDIIMFVNPNCPWCKKAIEQLNKAGKINDVYITDVTGPEGAMLSNQYGVTNRPVPSYVSKKYKTGTEGYKEKVSELVKSLKPSKKSDNPKKNSNSKKSMNLSDPKTIRDNVETLDILLFTREECGWCTKAKGMANDMGLLDLIKIVDVETPEGQHLMKAYIKGDKVPAWASLKTNKTTVGFKPLEEIVNELL